MTSELHDEPPKVEGEVLRFQHKNWQTKMFDWWAVDPMGGEHVWTITSGWVLVQHSEAVRQLATALLAVRREPPHQAHEDLETAVKLLREQWRLYGPRPSDLGPHYVCTACGAASRLPDTIKHFDGCAVAPIGVYLAAHDARTSAATAAREGGGDG